MKLKFGDKVKAHNGNLQKPVTGTLIAYEKYNGRPWIINIKGRRVAYKFAEAVS